MDFSTYLVALRDRMTAGLEKPFRSELGVAVCGRVAALHAWFDANANPKLLGLVQIGGAPTHSHEHRLLFAVPELTEQALDDWWNYARKVQEELVRPDAAHGFTLISLVLLYQTAEPRALRRMRRLASEVSYGKPGAGWSSIRLAAVEAGTGKITANRLGAALTDVLRPALP